MSTWADVARAGNAKPSGSASIKRANETQEKDKGALTTGMKTLQLKNKTTRPSIKEFTFQQQPLVLEMPRAWRQNQGLKINVNTKSNVPKRQERQMTQVEVEDEVPSNTWSDLFTVEGKLKSCIPYGMSWADAAEEDIFGFTTGTYQPDARGTEVKTQRLASTLNREVSIDVVPSLTHSATSSPLEEIGPPHWPTLNDQLVEKDTQAGLNGLIQPIWSDPIRRCDGKRTVEVYAANSTGRTSYAAAMESTPKQLIDCPRGPAVDRQGENNTSSVKVPSPGLLTLRRRMGVVKATTKACANIPTITKASLPETHSTEENQARPLSSCRKNVVPLSTQPPVSLTEANSDVQGDFDVKEAKVTATEIRLSSQSSEITVATDHHAVLKVTPAEVTLSSTQPEIMKANQYSLDDSQLVDNVINATQGAPPAPNQSQRKTKPSTGLTVKQRKAERKATHEARKMADAQRKASQTADAQNVIDKDA